LGAGRIGEAPSAFCRHTKKKQFFFEKKNQKTFAHEEHD
jgi:hypothetical protein